MTVNKFILSTALQLEFWEFKHDVFACELLVDTRESLHLEDNRKQTLMFTHTV